MSIIIDVSQGVQGIAAMDMIRRAMYLINAVAAGEIPDDADLNDALLTLNEMLDSWDLQPLAVFDDAAQTFTTIPGQATYDWGLDAGVTGIQTQRPVFLNNATCVRNGVTTPVEVITQPEYDRIGLKSLSQPLVERVLYVNTFPLGSLTCYPVPSEAVTLTFDTARQIVGPVTLQSIIALPPGYQRAIRYNLAVDLWPEYTNPSVDIESVRKTAREALGKVKVANIRPVPATFDDIPDTDGGSRGWDWRIG